VRQNQLRVALFSGNYNYQRDGANKALNLLVGFLERQGVAVRVYSPTSATPAFEPTGTLISDYRLALGMDAATKRDLEAFAPNLIHLSAPDRLAFTAKYWARAHGVPVVSSVHTRFDTYLTYYGLSWVNSITAHIMHSFYRDIPEVYAPSESMADQLRADGMATNIKIWSRGVDARMFSPARRSLVMEKGLDDFADAIDALKAKGVAHRVLIVGRGLADDFARTRMPQAVFAGQLEGGDLARAYASSDMLFNPSTTETFGNVTLEAMACGLPVVGARATGTSSLVHHGISGQLVTPGDIAGYATALTTYLTDDRAAAMAGEAGLALSRRYTWDEINQTMLDHYMELVGGPVMAPQSVLMPLVDRVVTALRAA
jgi:phosphatidylinositol alpha 1,6-mannosyltransferase